MTDLYFLLEFPIFRDLDGDDIDALGATCEKLSLPEGVAVCLEGDPGDAMYIVQSGVLEVSKLLGKKRLHINLVSAGEFFGEMALIDGTPRSADVMVKEAAQVIRFSVNAFTQLKKEKPVTALRVAEVLLKTLSFRVRRSTSRALNSEAAPKPTPKPKPKPKVKKAAKKKKKKRA